MLLEGQLLEKIKLYVNEDIKGIEQSRGNSDIYDKSDLVIIYMVNIGAK